MGGGNPIKDLAEFTTDTLVNPIREGFRAIGADGVVDGIDKVKGISSGLTDRATGQYEKDKQKAKDAGAAAASKAKNAADEQTRKSAVAADLKKNQDRMATGSRSRTLLTGGSGLEDEEDTITRRTLSGM